MHQELHAFGFRLTYSSSFTPQELASRCATRTARGLFFGFALFFFSSTCTLHGGILHLESLFLIAPSRALRQGAWWIMDSGSRRVDLPACVINQDGVMLLFCLNECLGEIITMGLSFCCFCFTLLLCSHLCFLSLSLSLFFFCHFTCGDSCGIADITIGLLDRLLVISRCRWACDDVLFHIVCMSAGTGCLAL